MGDVLRVKQQLTGATTSIRKGAEILDAMAVAVRAQLTQVEGLLADAEPAEALVADPGAGVRDEPAQAVADRGPPAERAERGSEPEPPAELF
jgi:hypothetical protein